MLYHYDLFCHYYLSVLFDFQIYSPFAVIITSTFLGWVFTAYLNVRSGADVRREGLMCSLHFNSSLRCSVGLRSGQLYWNMFGLLSSSEGKL